MKPIKLEAIALVGPEGEPVPTLEAFNAEIVRLRKKRKRKRRSRAETDAARGRALTSIERLIGRRPSKGAG